MFRAHRFRAAPLAAAFIASALALPNLARTQTPAGARPATPAPSAPAPELYSQLHWRTIGPEGNRFSAAAGIPGDPTTYYVGAASGGIWKTTGAGHL